MVRMQSIDKYELDVRKGLQEIYDITKLKMESDGDLLLCYQNGFISFDGCAAVGIGEEGGNSMQALNSISFKGIGDTTKDFDCFKKQDGFIFGTTEFENTIQAEKHRYLIIWENNYFLRILTQIINISRGEK